MLIRRIRRTEQDPLADLCRSDQRWSKYFSEHGLWLNKALKDVSSNDRVVFGGFETFFEEGDNYRNQLVACLFLKLSQFERSIEFKNLILPSNATNLGTDDSEAAFKLIEKAVRFCEVRGIQKIEIELPQEEYSIISIFLSLHFKVVAIRERYNPGNSVCILERTMGDKYYGDPFDKIKFARWLIKSYVPSEITDEQNDDNLVKIHFSVKSFSIAFSKDNPIGYKKHLRGTLWILEEDDLSEGNISRVVKRPTDQPTITLLLAESLNSEVKKRLYSEGIIFFDKAEAREIAGDKASSLSIPIDEQNIGGAITVLEYERIMAYSKSKTITYYLLSGLHWGLTLSDDDEPLVLAIYCPSWKNKGAGIVGCCQIHEIRRPFFHELLNEEIPEDSALSKEDLGFYKTYSEYERVAALKCTQVALFSNPLPLKNGDWMANREIQGYLDREIVHNIANSAYLDSESSNNLMQLARAEGSLQITAVEKSENASQTTERRFRVGLSFPGEHRKFIGDVATLLAEELGYHRVFYDQNYEDELARLDLDVYLGNLYRNECDLIVPFFSEEYVNRRWCRLEWRHMRDIIFNVDRSDSIMPFRFDDVQIQGLLNFDGFITVDARSPKEISQLILSRLRKI
ncbi:MAG: TIR domain-containing protein [Cyanobacteria bacterium J06638_20]